MTAVQAFCHQVRARSAEHRKAVRCLGPAELHGQIVAIFRQELDSMVRVIYLLSIEDRNRRHELIQAAVDGQTWTHAKKRKRITDREMVELADCLQGWTQSVYRFGCAFIHLSSFHDYRTRDPMQAISDEEREAILSHMRHYHGGPASDRPSFEEVAFFLPMVFDKIASNLEHYIVSLENDAGLET
jgi:hypothetical protein